MIHWCDISVFSLCFCHSPPHCLFASLSGGLPGCKLRFAPHTLCYTVSIICSNIANIAPIAHFWGLLQELHRWLCIHEHNFIIWMGYVWAYIYDVWVIFTIGLCIKLAISNHLRALTFRVLFQAAMALCLCKCAFYHNGKIGEVIGLLDYLLTSSTTSNHVN